MRIQVPEIEQIAHIHLGVNPQADVTEHEFVLQRARVGGAKVLGGLVTVGGVARGDFVVDVAWVGGAEVFFRLVCEGVGGGGAVEGHLLGGRHGVEESLILFLADVQESMRVVYLVIFVISVS